MSDNKDLRQGLGLGIFVLGVLLVRLNELLVAMPLGWTLFYTAGVGYAAYLIIKD